MKKITIWRNPTPLDPRWDAEIVDDNGERVRVIKITEEKAIKLIKALFKNPKGE